MQSEDDAPARYVVPRYQADGDPAWYHVLHGTVPGHQIDFIYQPVVPQGRLTQTHFAHIARLLKYIEPREKAAFAFAIGNLSRDDVQHEPGHGGVAILFSLRVEGVIDHASRAMPPYAHGVLAIDRALDEGVLLEAVTTFYRWFLHQGPSDATGGFYRSYVQVMNSDPDAVEAFLARYIADFDELPQPGRSKLGADFIAPEGVARDRITIVYPDNEPFSTVASVASALGSVLYRSNVKWTTISNGGDFDIPGGTSIRFVPESEAPRDPKGLLLSLDDVPRDDAEIAEKLFHAKPRETTAAPPRAGWRAQYAKQAAASPADGAGAEAPRPRLESTRPPAAGHAGAPAPGAAAMPRRQRTLPPGGKLPGVLPGSLTESSSRLPRAQLPGSLTESSSRLPRAQVPVGAGAAPAAAESLPLSRRPRSDTSEGSYPGAAIKERAPGVAPSERPGTPIATATTADAEAIKSAAPASARAAPQEPATGDKARVLGVAAAPDEEVNLDALAHPKPGKGRWVVVGGLVVAAAVAALVVASGPADPGSVASQPVPIPTPSGSPPSVTAAQSPSSERTASPSAAPVDTSKPEKTAAPPSSSASSTTSAPTASNTPAPTGQKQKIPPKPIKPKSSLLDDPNLN